MAMAFRIQFAFVTAAALAACAETPQDFDEDTGQVSVPLVTTGSDGAQYALPAGSYLEIYNDNFYDQFSLDGDVAQLAISLPTGDYQVQLSHPAGYTDEWPLLRTDGGGTTTVTAALLTPMPVPVTILEEDTTSLVLSFQVPELPVIVFGQGSLLVDAEVELGEASGILVAWEGGFVVTSATFYPAAPAGLSSLMPGVVGGGFTISFSTTFRVSGPWVVAAANTVCAPGIVETRASNDPGVSDFLEEVLTSPQFCLSQDAPDVASAQLVGFRAGAPRTASFAALGSSYQFVAIPSVTLTDSINFFDGSTFDLRALVGNNVGSGGLSMRIRGSTGGPRVPWYQATAEWPSQIAMTALP
jgi:hypothetical protein